MNRSKSSKRWLHDHFSDTYVKRAQAEGLRARSVYKLMEIDRKYGLFRQNRVVVDLGAAPGSWSAYAASVLGARGKVFALDLLPMRPINQVEYLQGDFSEQKIKLQLKQLVGSEVDIVLSDMAPNLTGVKCVDQMKSTELVRLAVDFATEVLKPKGSFLVKLFCGSEFEDLISVIKDKFVEVQVIKPAASRIQSREVFLLARQLKSYVGD